jgi:hypothetical protein
MTDKEQLIINLMLHRISEAEFLEQYGLDPRVDPSHVLQLIDEATASRHADGIECALLLGFRFGFPKDIVPTLCKLLPATWHRQHENMAMIIEDMPDPIAVEPLYQAALTKYDYLDYDDTYALANKCIWALGAIANKEAESKLYLLAQSDIRFIKRDAIKWIVRLRDKRRPL